MKTDAFGSRLRQVVRGERIAIRELTRAEIYTQLNRKQFMRAALNLGIDRSDIEAAIDALQDPHTRMTAAIEFDESQTFERDNDLLTMLAEDMGISPADLDAAWLNALAETTVLEVRLPYGAIHAAEIHAHRHRREAPAGIGILSAVSSSTMRQCSGHHGDDSRRPCRPELGYRRMKWSERYTAGPASRPL